MLMSEIKGLDSAITKLTERLSPVMRPLCAANPAVAPNAPEELFAPLADHLRNQAKDIRQQASEVRALIEHLEL